MWPMIVLRTPKGWTCPKEIDGKRTEDYWRSHQVPMGDMNKNEHIKLLETWMKSYKPEELFDDERTSATEQLGALMPRARAPHERQSARQRRICLLKRPAAAELPRLRGEGAPSPARCMAESTRVDGRVSTRHAEAQHGGRNFRLFSPDENNSNRWQDALEVTNRAWMAERFPYDDHLAPDGRVMEMLSEHQMPGMARGISPHRPARILLVLRGVHPHHRLDVQSARQVAEGVQSHPMAAARSHR